MAYRPSLEAWAGSRNGQSRRVFEIPSSSQGLLGRSNRSINSTEGSHKSLHCPRQYRIKRYAFSIKRHSKNTTVTSLDRLDDLFRDIFSFKHRSKEFSIEWKRRLIGEKFRFDLTSFDQKGLHPSESGRVRVRVELVLQSLVQ